MGKVEVLKNNQVYLKDLDVDNIPEHIDVVLEPREKEVILIGKKIDPNNPNATRLLQKAAGAPSSVQKVQTQMFEEQSHEEMHSEKAFFFDPVFKVRTVKDDLSIFVRSIVPLAFLTAFLLTVVELYECKKYPQLQEEQELSEMYRSIENQLKRNALKQVSFMQQKYE